MVLFSQSQCMLRCWEWWCLPISVLPLLEAGVASSTHVRAMAVVWSCLLACLTVGVICFLGRLILMNSIFMNLWIHISAAHNGWGECYNGHILFWFGLKNKQEKISHYPHLSHPNWKLYFYWHHLYDYQPSKSSQKTGIWEMGEGEGSWIRA